MTNEGWIKIHRRILDWEWYDDINTKVLFIHLLIKANHEGKSWHGVKIERGQTLTGRKKLAEQTKLTEQQIRTSLTKLKSTNEITIKSTNLYSLITINNYNEYQVSNQQPAKRATKEQPTSNHKQECKNEKNDKENIYGNKFQKLSYINKGIMFKRINEYVKNFSEEPSQKQIEHWIDTELNS